LHCERTDDGPLLYHGAHPEAGDLAQRQIDGLNAAHTYRSAAPRKNATDGAQRRRRNGPVASQYRVDFAQPGLEQDAVQYMALTVPTIQIGNFQRQVTCHGRFRDRPR
jgi:hypothetical protein